MKKKKTPTPDISAPSGLCYTNPGRANFFAEHSPTIVQKIAGKPDTIWASLLCYDNPHWKVQQETAIRKAKYEWNHTVRAEITYQHATDVSSKPQWNAIRELEAAQLLADHEVETALNRKQKIKVWIDDTLYFDSEAQG